MPIPAVPTGQVTAFDGRSTDTRRIEESERNYVPQQRQKTKSEQIITKAAQLPRPPSKPAVKVGRSTTQRPSKNKSRRKPHTSLYLALSESEHRHQTPKKHQPKQTQTHDDNTNKANPHRNKQK
uniref:Uncharacterized protein n=1 Tax=Strigamia maritima TaxID=126957 RepID=T1J217_STRMM